MHIPEIPAQRGLGMKIPEIPAQRKFDQQRATPTLTLTKTVCHAHKPPKTVAVVGSTLRSATPTLTPTNRPKLWLLQF